MESKYAATASPFKRGTLKDACYRLLAQAGPTGAKVHELVNQIKETRMAHLAGSTPANTVCSALSSGGAIFSRIAPGTYSLTASAAAAERDATNMRKRTSRTGGESHSLPESFHSDESAQRRKRARGGDDSAERERAYESSLNGAEVSVSPPGTPSSLSFSGGTMGRGHRRLSSAGKSLHSRHGPRDEWLSQRDACCEVLSDAGPEGMTVTEVVDEIKRRDLARLDGRTPHNSITRCLSADDSFFRIQPGRYALHDSRMAMCAEVLSLFSAPSDRGTTAVDSNEDADSQHAIEQSGRRAGSNHDERKASLAALDELSGQARHDETSELHDPGTDDNVDVSHGDNVSEVGDSSSPRLPRSSVSTPALRREGLLARVLSSTDMQPSDDDEGDAERDDHAELMTY